MRDLEEALMATEAIGEDTLQKKARGFSVPDSFTHGTRQQWIRAFLQRFQTGQFTGKEL